MLIKLCPFQANILHELEHKTGHGDWPERRHKPEHTTIEIVNWLRPGDWRSITQLVYCMPVDL
jgi:hypothetical protein